MAVERITVTGEGSSIKVLVRTTPAAGVSDADVAAAIAAAVLDDLADVTSPSPGDGQVLTWDAGTSRWVPAAAAGGAVDSVNGHTGTVVLGAADVGAAPSARTLVAGVGLSGGGDLSVDRTFDVDYGTTAGTAAEGDDVRLSDARTPTAHHASHENGGSDEVALDASQVTSGTVGTARLGTGTADNTTYLRGDQTWATVTPGASAINDLSDVDTATDPPATDDVLAWDGTLWTPAALTAADTGAIPASLIDAKGDVIVGTAADTAARLAVGSDGQVLTADSAETSGVKWAAATAADVGAQPSDADLTAFAGLSPSNDDFLQRKAGAWTNRTVAQVKADLGVAAAPMFGDGSDGDVTISSDTTISTNKFYNNLTVNSGVTLTLSGCAVWVKGTLTLNGRIACDGGNAPAGSHGYGSGGPPDSIAGVFHVGGSSGGSGIGGAAGSALSGGASRAGAAGGAGGTGGSGAGGAAGNSGAINDSIFRTGVWLWSGQIIFGTRIGGGTGGGGGRGDGTYHGGGGGGGAGVVIVVARAVTGSGTLSAKGGNGSTNVNGNVGGGGGGGGGLVVLQTGSTSHSFTIDVAGGTAGNGVGTGAAGTAGNAGRSIVHLGVAA